MSKVQALQSNALTEAPSTPRITRTMAFKGDGYRVVRSRTTPGAVSGWHHHGNYDVFGYIVAGTARFEHGPGGKESITVRPGDFFHVPAHTVHRDVNPSSNEGQEMILFLHGTGQMVVNVDGPDQS
jgi:quercetin dioxygenase-like cupin family protein